MDTAIMEEAIQLGIEAGVATITLNRPAVMNAMTPPMWATLLAMFQRIEHDAAIRCVVLTGAGKNFCSGQDIAEFAKLAGRSQIEIAITLKRDVDLVNPLFLTMERIPQPIVASARGVVAGGGLSLVTACDLVVASQTAQFLVAQIRLGALADASLAFNLRRVIGIRKAKQYCMLGEKMPVAEAAELGLVNWVTPDDELEARTAEIAKRLAATSVSALAATKSVLNRSFNNSLAQHAAEEAFQVGRCVMDAEFMEKVKAFSAPKPGG